MFSSIWNTRCSFVIAAWAVVTIFQFTLSKEKEDWKDLRCCEVSSHPFPLFLPSEGIYRCRSVLLTKSIQYVPLEISAPCRSHFWYISCIVSCFTACALRDIYVWRPGKILTMVTQALILLAGPFSLCSVLWLKIVGNVFTNRYEIVLLLLKI